MTIFPFFNPASSAAARLLRLQLDLLLEESCGQRLALPFLIIWALTSAFLRVSTPVLVIIIIFITRRGLILLNGKQPFVYHPSIRTNLNTARRLTPEPFAVFRNLLASEAPSGFFFRKDLADTSSPASSSLSDDEPFGTKTTVLKNFLTTFED